MSANPKQILKTLDSAGGGKRMKRGHVVDCIFLVMLNVFRELGWSELLPSMTIQCIVYRLYCVPAIAIYLNCKVRTPSIPYTYSSGSYPNRLSDFVWCGYTCNTFISDLRSLLLHFQRESTYEIQRLASFGSNTECLRKVLFHYGHD